MRRQKMILDAQKLSYAYQDIPLFESVTLQIQKPGLYIVKGPNGSGKTTLLKILSGILKSPSGSVTLNTEPLFVGHLNALHEQLSLTRMLSYYAHFLNGSLSDRVNRALTAFGLDRLCDKKIMDFSYGQKRKASLMRLFLSDHLLWILDEPFQGLDQESQDFLWAGIEAFMKKGGVCVMTTHEPFSSIQIPHQVFDLGKVSA